MRGAQSGGALLAFENVVAPGDGPPRHVHAAEDGAWYVLEGDLRFQLGDELADAAAGSFVFVPRGTAHCFQNAGDALTRILALFTPAGIEPFFARLGADVGMEVVSPPLSQRTPADR